MKKERGHDIHLSDLALEVLERMRPISGHREYVFPGRNDPRIHVNVGTARMAFKRLEVDTTAHGLRSLASTTMNEATVEREDGHTFRMFEEEIIEVALSHLDKDKVRDAYNNAMYMKQRKILLDWWEKQIRAAGLESC